MFVCMWCVYVVYVCGCVLTSGVFLHHLYIEAGFFFLNLELADSAIATSQLAARVPDSASQVLGEQADTTPAQLYVGSWIRTLILTYNCIAVSPRLPSILLHSFKHQGHPLPRSQAHGQSCWQKAALSDGAAVLQRGLV